MHNYDDGLTSTYIDVCLSLQVADGSNAIGVDVLIKVRDCADYTRLYACNVCMCICMQIFEYSD